MKKGDAVLLDDQLMVNITVFNDTCRMYGWRSVFSYE